LIAVPIGSFDGIRTRLRRFAFGLIDVSLSSLQ
jgi:hypothetical protein